MRMFSAMLALVVLVGCTSARGTKKNADGTVEEIIVKSFLAKIDGGTYTSTNSDGSVTTLSVQSATPDQQSIAVLAGGIVDMSKTAMMLMSRQTNNPATNSVPAP